jgi:hypothetical protein
VVYRARCIHVSVSAKEIPIPTIRRQQTLPLLLPSGKEGGDEGDVHGEEGGLEVSEQVSRCVLGVADYLSAFTAMAKVVAGGPLQSVCGGVEGAQTCWQHVGATMVEW